MNNPLLAIQVSGASAPISEEAQVAESVLGSERLPFASKFRLRTRISRAPQLHSFLCDLELTNRVLRESKFKEHGRITPGQLSTALTLVSQS
jgi:hypothetical protein